MVVAIHDVAVDVTEVDSVFGVHTAVGLRMMCTADDRS